MASVKLENVAKSFGTVAVLKQVDLAIDDGEFVVFVGPSGCGKSTLLRILAGLEQLSSGAVHIGERNVTNLVPASRGIAMVFQSYALYPHLTVRGNISLGLKQAKVPAPEIAQRIERASQMLSLEALLERHPAELSGGQRQRVAIGRAIVREPDVFLFDEPLSNLDAALRAQVRYEIASLHKKLGTTMVYVTHDQVEAMTLADRIVVMAGGLIQQVGTPRELYENPFNQFVAGFIGSPKMNFLHMFESDGRQTLCSREQASYIAGFRPEHLQLSQDLSGEGLVGNITLVEYLGSESYAYVDLPNGQKILVRISPESPLKAGESVLVSELRAGYRFDPSDGRRINPD